MYSNELNFNNNMCMGGFQEGGYDTYAQHPVDFNWTRQSRFLLPMEPKTKWKYINKNEFIVLTKSAFVIDKTKNALFAVCDNNIVGSHYGKLINVDVNGTEKTIYTCDRRLNPPVIGKEGLIYMTTTGDEDSSGHKLLCLYPDGKFKWEFAINDVAYSKPVIDADGNIYIFTYSNRIGKLISIHNGNLNWIQEFNSVNWYEPIISKNGHIYLGLNVNKTLCAINKDGNKLWEKSIGQGLGYYPMNINKDGILFFCLADGKLYASDPDGEILWTYTPENGRVITSPAMDREGNLYINSTNGRLISLSNEGKMKWQSNVVGYNTTPPIIDSFMNLYLQSYSDSYPHSKSWLNAFTKDGDLIWNFEMPGYILSSAIADDNLIYALLNVETLSKKGWTDKMNIKCVLYAIGE